MITAGFHRVCITPRPGTPLAGFAAREQVATGVHDDLFARALVLESAGQSAVFVSVDVLALGSDFVQRVRQAITSRTRIPGRSVMLSSTHTHAGPVTLLTFFNPGAALDDRYMDQLAGAIEEAVAHAWTSRRPARVGVGSGGVTGIGVNRRTPDQRPVDGEIGILEVETLDGEMHGTLINHSCHPTVLGPDNLLITGDFPAFTVQRLGDRLGEGGFAMFVNGAQGNISVGHSSELSAIGIITPGRTFERAAELGHQLADAVVEALPAILKSTSLPIAVASDTLSLPCKPYPPVAETTRRLRAAETELERLVGSGAPQVELARAKSDRLYASIANFYAGVVERLGDGRVPIEVQAIRVGDALFVAAPAEVFVEIGLRIKQAAAHPIFLMGITNGYIGYLPTREAYTAGGYEVVSAMCTEGAEDLFIEKVRELDSRLFAGELAAR